MAAVPWPLMAPAIEYDPAAQDERIGRGRVQEAHGNVIMLCGRAEQPDRTPLCPYEVDSIPSTPTDS
jgi:hypothetical protein